MTRRGRPTPRAAHHSAMARLHTTVLRQHEQRCRRLLGSQVPKRRAEPSHHRASEPNTPPLRPQCCGVRPCSGRRHRNTIPATAAHHSAMARRPRNRTWNMILPNHAPPHNHDHLSTGRRALLQVDGGERRKIQWVRAMLPSGLQAYCTRATLSHA